MKDFKFYSSYGLLQFLVVLEKFAFSYLLQIALKSMWLPIQQEIITKRVNPPYSPYTQSNPSWVIFRFETQLFRGWYSRDAWTRPSRNYLRQNGGKCAKTFHIRDVYCTLGRLFVKWAISVSFCSFDCSFFYRSFCFTVLRIKQTTMAKSKTAVYACVFVFRRLNFDLTN